MRSWIVSGYAIVLGIIIGLVSWLFLSVVYKGIHVGWHTVPKQFDIPFGGASLGPETTFVGIVSGLTTWFSAGFIWSVNMH